VVPHVSKPRSVFIFKALKV